MFNMLTRRSSGYFCFARRDSVRRVLDLCTDRSPYPHSTCEDGMGERLNYYTTFSKEYSAGGTEAISCSYSQESLKLTANPFFLCVHPLRVPVADAGFKDADKAHHRNHVRRQLPHFHTFIPTLVLRYFVLGGRGVPQAHGGNMHFSHL